MLDFLYWPLGAVAALCAAAAAVTGLRFLRTRNFRYDSASVAAIEVGLVSLAANLAVGSLWQHSISGGWWSWNVPLASVLACGLLYTGHLILRHAVDEPTQRATFCAVFSIFAFLDIPIIPLAVAWWCLRHPQPPMWQSVSVTLPLAASGAAFLLGAILLAVVRARQEEAQRELDSLRRTIHAF